MGHVWDQGMGGWRNHQKLSASLGPLLTVSVKDLYNYPRRLHHTAAEIWTKSKPESNKNKSSKGNVH